MDVCNAANRIGTYVPAASSGGTTPTSWTITSTETSTVNQQIKNIDAVSVEANLVSCNALTIAGQPITGGLATLTEKTQNQTATAGTTTFTGTVNAESFNATGGTFTASTINTQNIVPTAEPILIGGTNKTVYIHSVNQRVGINTTAPTAGTALDVNGSIRTNSQLLVVPTITTTSNIVQSLTGTTNVLTTGSERRIVLGVAETTNNAGYIGFNKVSDTSGDASNRLSLYLSGKSTTGPRLDVNGTNTNVVGAMAVSGALTLNGGTLNNYLGNGQNSVATTATVTFNPFTAREFTLSFFNVSVGSAAWRMDVTVSPVNSATCIGSTNGTKGNNNITWTGGTIRLSNDTTNTLTATAIMNGFLRFEMVGSGTSGPIYSVYGSTTISSTSSSTCYTNQINGIIEMTSSPIYVSFNASAARTGGQFYLSYM
jgi:hypothetical protein